MLGRILGSKLKSSLLEFFIHSPHESFSLTDIVKRSGLSLGGVHSTLKEFVKNEILVSGYNGKNEVFSLNLNNYIVESLLRVNMILRPETESMKKKVLERMNTLSIYLLLEGENQVLVVGTAKDNSKKNGYGDFRIKFITPEDYVDYNMPEEIPVYEKYKGGLVKTGKQGELRENMEMWYTDLLTAKDLLKENKKWAFMIAYETCFSLARRLLGVGKNISKEDILKTFEKEYVRKGLCPERCSKLMKSFMFRKEFPGNFEHASFYLDTMWSALDHVREMQFPDMEIVYES